MGETLVVVIATLMKLKSADGLIEMEDHIPLGKKYTVNTATLRTVKLFNLDKKVSHEKDIIDVWPTGGYLVLELLELGGAP